MGKPCGSCSYIPGSMIPFEFITFINSVLTGLQGEVTHCFFGCHRYSNDEIRFYYEEFFYDCLLYSELQSFPKIGPLCYQHVLNKPTVDLK